MNFSNLEIEKLLDNGGEEGRKNKAKRKVFI